MQIQVHATRDSDDRVGGGVPLSHEGKQIVTRERANALARTGYVPSERVIRVENLLCFKKNEVVGHVLGLVDFLSNHLRLALDIVGQKATVEEHIREDIGGKPEIVTRDTGVDAG